MFLWDTDIKVDLYCNSWEEKLNNTKTKCLPHINPQNHPVGTEGQHWSQKVFFNKSYYNYRAIQSVVALSTKQCNTGTILQKRLKISSGRASLKFEQINSGSAVPVDMGWSNAGILITVFQGFPSQSCTTLMNHFPMFFILMNHGSVKWTIKKLNQKCVRDIFKQPYSCMQILWWGKGN